KPFFKRFEQSDTTLTPTDEQNIALLELVRTPIDDLWADAHFDDATRLEENVAVISQHQRSWNCCGPLAFFSLASQSVAWTFAAEVERVEFKQGCESIEGIRLGDKLD